MTDQTSSPKAGRKTEQAIKISATWTPDERTAGSMAEMCFGTMSPLMIRGGRLTINAAIAIDMTDPMQAARAAARVAELRQELSAIGELHTFSTQAGSVPAGTAERLPDPLPEGAGLAGEAM